MVQPLPSSLPNLDVLPAPNAAPHRLRQPRRPNASPASTLLLPARRSLEARRRRRSLASFLPVVRREHVGLAFTVLILLLSLAATGGRILSGARASAVVPAASLTTLRVRPGDTLWAIARGHGPAGSETPARIEALLRINRLPRNTVLVPGQTLRVPAER